MPSIRHRLLSNRYMLDNQFSYQNAISDYVYKNRDYFANPRYENIYLRTRSDYQQLLDIVKENYVGSEDPDSYANRMALGQVINSLFPDIDPTYAAENIEDLMYYATGYRTDVNGLVQQFTNTFNSTGSSLLASLKMAGLYLGGGLGIWEDFESKKQETLDSLRRYAKDYRPDLTEYGTKIETMLDPLVTSTAQILPSMLPTLAISGIGAVASMASGGIIPISLAGLTTGLAKGTLSTTQFATGLGLTGLRSASTFLMEMGSSALDMAQAGFDDDIILGVSAGVGLANGLFESFGDAAINRAVQPLSRALRTLNDKQKKRVIRNTIGGLIRDYAKETAGSIARESATEAAQEVSTMFGYNFAASLQEERGRLPEGVRKYTPNDFADAIFETIKQTSLGTFGVSLFPGAIRLIENVASPNSELRQVFSANRFTTIEGMNARIPTSRITGFDGISTEGITEESFSPISPIEVVRVGDKFVATSPDAEQAYAVRNNKGYVNAKLVDMSTEAAVEKSGSAPLTVNDMDRHSGMSLESINETIEVGLANDAVEGFTYYDSEMKATSGDVAYVSIKAKDISQPALIPVTESDSVSPTTLEGDVFGQTFTKKTAEKRTSNTSQTTEASSTTDISTQDDSSESTSPSNTTQDTGTFSDEDLGIEVERDSEGNVIADTEDTEADAELSEEAIAGTEAAEEIATDAEEAAFEEMFPEAMYTQADEAIAETEASTETATEEIQAETSPSENTVIEQETQQTEEIQHVIEKTSQQTTENISNQIEESIDETKAKADTKRRNAEIEARNAAHNEWEDIKSQLDGQRSHDVDVLTDYFRDKLKDSDVAKQKPKALDAMARASAEIMVGFAKASGLTGRDYYNTLHGFLYNVAADENVLYAKTASKTLDIGETVRIANKNDAISLLNFLSTYYSEEYVPVDYTIENWNNFIGDGYIETPIGVIKIGDNQFPKLGKRDNGKRAAFMGMIIPTLKRPSFALQIKNGSRQTGNDSFELYKVFSDKNGKTWFLCAVVEIDKVGMVNISSYPVKAKDLSSRITKFPLAVTATNFDWQDPRRERDQGTVRIFSDSNVPSDSNGVNDVFTATDSDGSYIGWFNPDALDRYISIMEKAEPSTLIHELAHHFLTVITPSNPAYAMITNVYSKQFGQDGDTIGTNVQEAFAKDLEKYVYLRKSSNKRLNGIFKTLYDLASALWRTLSPNMRLTKEKKALFDAIFYEEEADAKPVKTANTKTAIVDTVERNVKESTEAPKPVETVAEESAEAATEAVLNEEAIKDELDIPDNATEETVEPVVAEEGQKIIEEPQTEESVLAEEAPVEYRVDNTDYFLLYGDMSEDQFYNKLGDTDGKYLSELMKKGKIDSKEIAAQLKEIAGGNVDRHISNLNETKNLVEPIVSMETRTTVYKYLSGLLGVDFDANAVEFYYGRDGSIYINLKKDIRYDISNDRNILINKSTPRFFKIPIESDSGKSISDYLDDWYSADLIRSEYLYDADYNENSDEEMMLGLQEGFERYSKPEVAALVFAYAYNKENSDWANGKTAVTTNRLLFSSDPAEERRNVRTFAIQTAVRMNNSTLFNAYSSVMKKIKEVTDKAEKEWNKLEKERKKELKGQPDPREGTIENAKTEYIYDSLTEEFGSNEPQTIFARYLEDNASSLGISEDVSGMDEDLKSMFFYDLAEVFRITSMSYTSLAHILEDGVKNPKKFNTARNLLSDMIKATKNGYKGRKISTDIGAMFRDSGSSASWSKVWDALSGDRNTTTVTDEEIKEAIAGLVNEDYSVANITTDGDNGYTSPLMILANYYSNRDSGASKTTDSFEYAGSDYVSISKEILEDKQGISFDSVLGDTRKVFADLTQTIKKAEGTESLKNVYSKASTYDFANALVNATQEKIAALRKQISSKEVTPEVQADIDRMKNDAKTLNSNIRQLESAVKKAGDSNTALKEQIKALQKDNKALQRLIEKAGGVDNLSNITSEIPKLKRELENKNKRIERLEKDGTAREKHLREKIKKMLNDPKYLTEKEIKEKFEECFQSIEHDIRRNNADSRVSVTLARIYNALKKGKKGTAIDPSLFESSFEGYDGYYDNLRDFAEKRGIIKDGKLEKRMNALTLQELSEFAQLVSDISKRGQERMEKEKKKRNEMWNDRINAVIRALPTLNLNKKTEAEMKAIIDELRMNFKDGINGTEQSGNAKKWISKYRIIEVQLRSISPELHDMLFGGVLDGEYVRENLNNATNSKDKFTQQRKEKISKKISELFGINQKDVDITFDRLFTKDRTVLGSMSPEEYAQKHGISWGTVTKRGTGFKVVVNDNLDDSLKPIAKKILSMRAYVLKEGLKGEKGDQDAASDYDLALNRGNKNGFTNQELMGIYTGARQSDGIRRLITDPKKAVNTNHLSVSNVLWVMDQFETSEKYSKLKKLADYLTEVVGERYSDTADVYYRQTNKILANINHYFPIRDVAPSEVKTLKDNNGMTKEGRIRADFIEERTHSAGEMDLDAITVAIRTIEDQENYIAFQEIYDKYKQMFDTKNSYLAAAIRSAYGSDGLLLLNNMNEWLDRVVGAEKNTRNDLENFFTKLRKNLTVSVLWMSPSVMLQQVPTYFLTANEVGFVNAATGLADYMRNAKERSEFVYRMSPQMRDRARMEIAEYRARQSSPMFRTESNKIASWLREHDKNNVYLKSRERFQKVVRWGMDFTQRIDTNMANAMWLAIYNYNFDRLQDVRTKNNMSEADYQEYVANIATQKVMSMQSSQGAKDNALAYSDKSEFIRSLLLFTSQLNKQYNMITGAIDRIRRQGFNKETFMNIASTVFYVGLVTAAAAFISGKALPDEDDDDWWDIILNAFKATGVESVSMIPLVGGTFNEILSGTIYYDTGAVGSFINAIKVWGKDKRDRRDNQLARANLNVFYTVGELLGLPTAPVRKISNTLMDDEMDFNWGELLNSEWGDFIRSVS